MKKVLARTAPLVRPRTSPRPANNGRSRPGDASVRADLLMSRRQTTRQRPTLNATKAPPSARPESSLVISLYDANAAPVKMRAAAGETDPRHPLNDAGEKWRMTKRVPVACTWHAARSSRPSRPTTRRRPTGRAPAQIGPDKVQWRVAPRAGV